MNKLFYISISLSDLFKQKLISIISQEKTTIMIKIKDKKVEKRSVIRKSVINILYTRAI